MSSRKKKKKNGGGAFGSSAGQRVRKPQVTAFPAAAGEFDEVTDATLSPEQAEYLGAIRNQFSDAKPVTRKGSGILHLFTPSEEVAFQSPPHIAAINVAAGTDIKNG